MSSPFRWVLCLVLGVSVVASAQAPKATVMPFPLELKRTVSGFSKEDREAMQREYLRILRLSGGQVPDFARYDLALKELKRQDCEREDECLTQLAQKAEALYALYVSVDYTIEGAVIAVGRVVRDDGKVASATQTVKVAKGRDAFKDVVKNVLTQLFVQLKIAELPATRPVEPPKTADIPRLDPVKPLDPPPPAPPIIVEDTGAGQRNAGKALVFVGGGVAVVGAIIAGVGGGIGGSAPKTGMFADTTMAAEQLRTGSTLATVGFIGLGVGAATAAVGAVLWGTATPPPVSQVTVVPVTNGAVVQLGGAF